jgi:hypothetical protein
MNFVARVLFFWLWQSWHQTIVEENIRVLHCRAGSTARNGRAPRQETKRFLFGHEHPEHLRR